MNAHEHEHQHDHEHGGRRWCEPAWASILLRLAIAVLFFAAATGKWLNGGPWPVVEQFRGAFKGSWLPEPMVVAHAYATPFIETLICLWLLSGFMLRWAWIFTTLFMLSLAFGMSVVNKHDVASSNYMYVLMCCIGLFFSQWDPLATSPRGRR